MNTIQSLTEHGVEIHNAEQMINSYKTKIGTMNGIYEIVDIEYDFNIRGKIITLKCSECGKVIQRTIVKSRNKWSELIKTCDCQKEAKRKLEFENLKILKKQKDDLILSRVGNLYGDYKIVSVDKLADKPQYTLKCMECEAIKTVGTESFERIKDFKCHKHFKQIIYDDSLIGNKYNFLTVVGYEHRHDRRKMKCKCDCGNIRLIEPFMVVNGVVKSCGCKHDELLTTHGLSKTRLYGIRNGMIQRCYNPNSHAYENYGGRGIRICDEWLNDENGLQNFIEWANSHGYSDDLSIDRIDVNGNYCSENCRWADSFVQANNKRPKEEWKPRKKKFEIDGVEYTLKELCKIHDTSEPAVRYRIKTLGMTLEQALKIPKIQNGRPRKAVNQ